MSTDNILTNTTGREYYIYQLGMLTDKLQNKANELENNYKNLQHTVANNVSTIGQTGLTRPYTTSFIDTINSTSENLMLNIAGDIRTQFVNTMYILYELYYVHISNSEAIADFKQKVIDQLNIDFAPKIKNNPFNVNEITTQPEF